MPDGSPRGFRHVTVHVRIDLNADRRLIDQASMLFLDALPRRLPFPEAARMLGLKARDLEAAYARLGLHPRHCLRRLRLARLHADLTARRFDTVAETLTRWGFPRTSSDVVRDYHALYGLTPDQTLNS